MSNRLSGIFWTILFSLCVVFLFQDWANGNNHVNEKQSNPEGIYRKNANKGTVGIISGGISGTYLHIATDLASVLDDNINHTLRILPVAGKGGVRNILDLLYLKGIDLAIVQTDILDNIERYRRINNIRERVNYLTKLYNAELHIITKREITDIKQLEGKKVNFWYKDSETDMTGSTAFSALGVFVKPVYIEQSIGIEKVKSGEISANVILAGKPSRYISGLSSNDGLHLLPVKYEGALADIYLPSTFSEADYPGLISSGKKVETIASGAVLAVYNWPADHPRYKKVAKFTEAFFKNFQRLKRKPRHEKWKEVNLAATLPRWQRFSHAQFLINQAKVTPSLSKSFESFLEQNGIKFEGPQANERRQRLLEGFIEFQRSN